MRKSMVWGLLVLVMFTAGCSRTDLDLDIGEAGKIELYSGTDGRMAVITDAEELEQITGEFNALTFRKGDSSTDYSGWRYLLNWYDERNQLMEKVVVLSETRIEYEDYFYEGEEGDGRIDLTRLDELLDAGQAAN